MQDTTGIINWDVITSQPGYWYRARVEINDVDYDSDVVMSCSINRGLFSGSEPSVGNAVAGDIHITMLEPSDRIPEMAQIIPYVQVVSPDGATASGWLQQGVFFIDTRSVKGDGYSPNILELHGYDAMLKADQDWPGTDDMVYPMLDRTMVGIVADVMGVEIDPRTWEIMTHDYYFNLPSDYICREVLQMIASAYAGNWTITKEGKLLLIGLYSFPEETNLLIDEDADYIVFGSDETAILV